MQVHYIDFDSDIFKKAVSPEPAVYIADNQRTENLQQAREVYHRRKPPLVQESRFYSWQKFKEIIFPGEEIAIREEKQSVALYEVLDKTEKETLGIDNYNDIIDFSARFHHFYLELQEYQVQELPSLKGWQQQRLQLIQEIRRKYKKYLKQRGLTDPALVRNENNFAPENLKSFDKIILLNTVNLTPLEKKLLTELEPYLEIELYLQLPPSDFSESELEFKGLTLPPTWPGELELYTAEEDMLQLASALFLSNPEQTSLLSPRLDETNYNRLISPSKMKLPREEKFSRTQIYKFIRSLYRLLQSSPPGADQIGLPRLLEAVSRSCFCRYFNLDSTTLPQIRELIQDNYLYLTREMVENQLPQLNSLLKEVERLGRISTMTELIDYMEQLNLNILKDPRWNNDLQQFYDSLLELSTLQEMELVSDWGRYYENAASGLLDRLLQYIEYKQVEPVLPEQEVELELKELYSASHISRDHLLVLNASQGWLMEEEGDFLLTEAQRREVGLPTAQENRKEKRYHFFRHLLTASKAEVLALKNKEENESPGAFMEELKLNYEKDFKKAPLDRQHYVSLYQNVFTAEAVDRINPAAPAREIETEDPPLEKKDFPGTRFYLSYYKYRTLEDCYFRFFLETLMDLERELGPVEKRLKPLTFGNIVHRFAEVMLKNMSLENLQLQPETAAEYIEQTFKNFKPKMDHRFQKYYERIVSEELLESMQNFLQGLKNRLDDYEINPRHMQVEYTPEGSREQPFYDAALLDYYLSGRIDLFIEGEKADMVIDFKSGGMNEAQLNFYALLLQRLQQEQSKPVYKSMYQVMDRQFLDVGPGEENEFRNELQEALEKFSRSDKYVKKANSSCRRCPYKNVCRVVNIS